MKKKRSNSEVEDFDTKILGQNFAHFFEKSLLHWENELKLDESRTVLLAESHLMLLQEILSLAS